MNKIVNVALSGSDWNPVPIPEALDLFGYSIQARTASDINVNYRGGAESSVFWTVKSGTVRHVSWKKAKVGQQLFVKGTPGTVIEVELVAGPGSTA